jgi:hypothetical protein
VAQATQKNTGQFFVALLGARAACCYKRLGCLIGLTVEQHVSYDLNPIRKRGMSSALAGSVSGKCSATPYANLASGHTDKHWLRHSKRTGALECRCERQYLRL